MIANPSIRAAAVFISLATATSCHDHAVPDAPSIAHPQTPSTDAAPLTPVAATITSIAHDSGPSVPSGPWPPPAHGPPPACSVSGLPQTPAGADATATLRDHGALAVLDGRIALAYMRGSEGPSGVALQPDGTSSGEPLSVSRAHGEDTGVPFPVLADGVLSLRMDSESSATRHGQSGSLVYCDGIGSVPAFSPTALDDGVLAHVEYRNSSNGVDCTSIVVAQPFALIVRPYHTANGLLDHVEVYAAREPRAPNTPATSWILPIHTEPREGTEFSHVAWIRSASGVDVPGVGYAVTFVFDNAVYFGWLGADLLPVAPPEHIRGPGASPDEVSLAWNGHEALVVFSDARGRPRATQPDGGTVDQPMAVYAARVAPGHPAGSTHRLATGLPTDSIETSPSAAALPNGDWVVAWAAAAPSRDAGAPTRQLWLRAFRPDVVAGAPAVPLTGNDDSDHPQIVAVADQIVAAMSVPTGDGRGVGVVSARCPSAP